MKKRSKITRVKNIFHRYRSLILIFKTIMCYNTSSFIKATSGGQIMHTSRTIKDGRSNNGHRSSISTDELASLYFNQRLSLPAVAAKVGMCRDSVCDRLHKAGYKLRTPRENAEATRNHIIKSRNTTPSGHTTEQLYTLYQTGQSAEDVAATAHITGAALRRRFITRGYTLRPISETRKLVAANQTPEFRKLYTYKAQEANKRRWQNMTIEEKDAFRASSRECWKHRSQSKIAESIFTTVTKGQITKQSRKRTETPDEQTLLELLYPKFPNIIVQKALGTFRIDFSIGNIAVELVSRRDKPGGNKCPLRKIGYILDSGYSLIEVFMTPQHPLSDLTVKKIITLINCTKRFPARACKYWMIRGSGEDIPIGQFKRDKQAGMFSYERGF
jgi:predicted DNA-binding protein YlxM (UPF0122 family)